MLKPVEIALSLLVFVMLATAVFVVMGNTPNSYLSAQVASFSSAKWCRAIEYKYVNNCTRGCSRGYGYGYGLATNDLIRKKGKRRSGFGYGYCLSYKSYPIPIDRCVNPDYRKVYDCSYYCGQPNNATGWGYGFAADALSPVYRRSGFGYGYCLNRWSGPNPYQDPWYYYFQNLSCRTGH